MPVTFVIFNHRDADNRYTVHDKVANGPPKEYLVEKNKKSENITVAAIFERKGDVQITRLGSADDFYNDLVEDGQVIDDYANSSSK